MYRSVGTQIQIISAAGHAEASAARLGPPIRAVVGAGLAEPCASRRRQGPPTGCLPVLSVFGGPVTALSRLRGLLPPLGQV